MHDPASNIIYLPQSIIPPQKPADPWIAPVLVSVIGMGAVSWGLILYGLSYLIGITATAFIAGGMVVGIIACAWRTK